MRVNFSIVALLDAEHEVDPPSLKNLVGDAEIPRRALEAVKYVARVLFKGHVLVHDIPHVLHFKVAVPVRVHKALLEKNLLVKEAFLAGKLLETWLEVVVAIDDYDDQEVVLGEVSFWVDFEAVVVVETSL